MKQDMDARDDKMTKAMEARDQRMCQDMVFSQLGTIFVSVFVTLLPFVIRLYEAFILKQ